MTNPPTLEGYKQLVRSLHRDESGTPMTATEIAKASEVLGNYWDALCAARQADAAIAKAAEDAKR